MACGFMSALLIGVFCTSQILNRNVYTDLLKFEKKILKLDALGKTASLKKEE